MAPTPAPKPRPREIGQPATIRPSFNWFTRADEWEVDPAEQSPDLRFPRSIKIYDQMRNDDQVSLVLRAITLPILRARWDLEPGDARPEVVQFVRKELGLPEPGQPQPRRRRGQSGVVWRDHLREALTALAFGFMPFEQNYEPTMPGDPGHPDGLDQPAFHLRKLAMRPPSSIRRILVGEDGGLDGVVQNPRPGTADVRQQYDGVTIPVDALVMYVIDKEGADWYGRSLLRKMYRSWLIKDQLIRIDAMAGERNGMGLPNVEFDPNQMSKEDALELATAVRAGATAGSATPTGAKLSLMGVTGSTHDILASIKYHDQKIAEAGLAHFLTLGHDNGARSLGDTMLDYFMASVDASASYFADTATHYVISDLVEYTFGADEAIPSLKVSPTTTEGTLTPEGMQMLTDAGILTPDAPLEAATRERYGLPAAEPATARPKLAPVQPLPVQPAAVAASQLTPDLAAFDERARQLAGRIAALADRRAP